MDLSAAGQAFANSLVCSGEDPERAETIARSVFRRNGTSNFAAGPIPFSEAARQVLHKCGINYDGIGETSRAAILHRLFRQLFEVLLVKQDPNRGILYVVPDGVNASERSGLIVWSLAGHEEDPNTVRVRYSGCITTRKAGTVTLTPIDKLVSFSNGTPSEELFSERIVLQLLRQIVYENNAQLRTWSTLISSLVPTFFSHNP